MTRYGNILKIVIGLWSLLASQSLIAQTGHVKGRVIDATTLEALPYAHIFINQTTKGTVSDENGNFSLDGVAAGRN